jgi:hypothetical protein
MSNHLHEFIENGFRCFAWLRNDVQHNVLKRFESLYGDAICFDAGDLVVIGEFKVIPDLVRLPFGVCWIEGFIEHEKLGSFNIGSMCREIDGKLMGDAFIRLLSEETRKKEWFYWHTWEDVGGSLIIHNEPKEDAVPWFMNEKLVQIAGESVCRFLSALNCININRVEHKPSEKLQKARCKRGKKPLFSYWTLEIDIPRKMVERVDLGGTHASPRVHLRKGHPREYAPGLWTWVKGHAVGNKKLGMVHKDYAIKHAA